MYVVRRPTGNWELRESHATARGPRARTLVSFRKLDVQALEHAARRAQRPLHAEQARRAAKRAGAPVAGRGADDAGAALLDELRHGKRISPSLARMLIAELGGGVELSEAEEGAAEWLGASAEDRGKALVDLLLLADALPQKRRRARLSFPKLEPLSS